MKFNKNIQVSFIDNKTKLKMWNKSYSISGGIKVFNLIVELLSYCEEDRSESEIKLHFKDVQEKLLDQILKLLIQNNILCNNFINKEMKKKLSPRMAMYLERNYSSYGDVNVIADSIMNVQVDIYAADEYSMIKESLMKTSICNINKADYNFKNEVKGNIAILDCLKFNVDEIYEKLNLVIDKYAKVYVIFSLSDRVVCIEGNKNIMSYYKNNIVTSEVSSNANKIVYLLLSKLIIDSDICNSDRTNVIEVDKNLSVKRYIIPKEDIKEFSIDYIPKKINETKDFQVDVNNIYSMVRNEKKIVDFIGYKDGNQMPMLTIETRIRDLENGEIYSYYSTDEDFTLASIKSITNAFNCYLNCEVKTENQFIVSQYGYENYREQIINESIFRLLKNENKVSNIDIQKLLETKFKYLSPLVDLKDITLKCIGNKEYEVYKITLTGKNGFEEVRVGNSKEGIIRYLLLNYSTTVNKDYVIENSEENKRLYIQKPFTNKSLSQEINDKRIALLKDKNVKLIEEGWSYNKYFNSMNLFISRVTVISD